MSPTWIIFIEFIIINRTYPAESSCEGEFSKAVHQGNVLLQKSFDNLVPMSAGSVAAWQPWSGDEFQFGQTQQKFLGLMSASVKTKLCWPVADWLIIQKGEKSETGQ